jgi:myo-inositol-1(or 4)-monophosphatase
MVGKYSKFASAGDKAAVRQARAGKLGANTEAAEADDSAADGDAAAPKGEDAPF